MESIVSTPRVAEEEMRQTEQQEDGCGMGGEQEEQGQLETPAVEKEKVRVKINVYVSQTLEPSWRGGSKESI